MDIDENFVVSQLAHSNMLMVQRNFAKYNIKVSEFDLDADGGIAIHYRDSCKFVWVCILNNGSISVVCSQFESDKSTTISSAFKYDIELIKGFINGYSFAKYGIQLSDYANGASHFRCGECGTRCEFFGRHGRKTDWFKRGEPLDIPHDFPIMSCIDCGEEWHSPEISGALDAYFKGRAQKGGQ